MPSVILDSLLHVREDFLCQTVTPIMLDSPANLIHTTQFTASSTCSFIGLSSALHEMKHGIFATHVFIRQPFHILGMPSLVASSNSSSLYEVLNLLRVPLFLDNNLLSPQNCSYYLAVSSAVSLSFNTSLSNSLINEFRLSSSAIAVFSLYIPCDSVNTYFNSPP